jgi:predicted metalloprotease with PDZ domain
VPAKTEAPIRYRLSARDPKTHLLAVEMRVPSPHPHPLVVAMPAWTPGSYKIRDFARHVREVSALDERGRRLPIEKRDKQSWVVHAPAAAPAVLRYRVYCNELGVRTSHLDDHHGHLNGGTVFLYAEGMMERPCEVELVLPRGWKAASALRSPGRGRFQAPGYDALIDAPFEIGSFEEAHFRERAIPHRLLLCGKGEVEAVDLVPDIQKIVRAGANLFGGLPYRDYTFMLHLASARGGGLEHASSASLIVDRDTFAPREKYLEFLELVAHEHFHAWNVKRLRPKALGPFDYARENYTRMLWVAEGWTSYYEKMLLRRAKLATAEEVLSLFAERIRALRETPGRAAQSVAEASFDAWIRYYQPNESTPNSTVSYYEKGQLVALLLDLEVRKRTQGRASLDDVLILLYERFAEADQGYPDAAVREAAEEVAKGSMRRFFADYVDGTEELDFEAALGDFGLQLVADGEGETPGADLGVVLEKGGSQVRIATVLDGGAAAAAGLDARDEIIAWEAVRIDREGLERRLAARRPGDRVELAVFRADLLRTFPVLLGRRGPKKLRIEKQRAASRLARKLYAGWMGEAF